MVKEIEKIIAPPSSHFVGDGFKVHNFIPSTPPLSMQRMDPFIMMDYNAPHYFPPSDKPRGVGVHPHKGFETVTIAYKGKIAHNDSSGGGGVISEGDVQWMTAANGILHKEFHEENFSKEGGDFQMVQMWVNLPAKNKSNAPKYQALKNSDIAKIELENSTGTIEVIAGHYKNIEGSASTFTPIHLYNVKLKKNAFTDFDLPANFNTALLVLEGEIKVNNELVKTNHFVLFENSGTTFTVEAQSEAKVLVLSGEPINEPIAAHGPFVMNTQRELLEAFNEYNSGKFGELS